MCGKTTDSPKPPILSPPKAEVTGSNPVGCANDFKWVTRQLLGQWSGLYPDYSV
jgi:hypothetical protein